MSELLDVLDGKREELARALAGELKEAECPGVAHGPSGNGLSLLGALRAVCATDDAAPARQWAQTMRDEALPTGLPPGELLRGLHCLERVVRFQVVKSIDQKRPLLDALTALGEAVDRMRRSWIETLPLAPTAEAGEPRDFLGFAASSDELICLATLHGKPFYINEAGRRLIGLGQEASIPSTSLHDYYDEASWKQLREVAVPAVRETGHWKGRARLRNATTGDLHDVATTMFLVKSRRSQRATCLAILHRDDSVRRELEEALAESQARKHAILESALDPIITIDHEGVITEFNRAAEQTFGHPREKVLGTKPSDVLFPPSKSAGHQDRIDRYLTAGEGSLLGRRVEVTGVRADGETFPVEMAMTISQEQGAPVLTFFVRDISQRKHAEQARARYAAELERSNRELEQFAYVASHDLQEPLRKIRAFGDRLQAKCGGGLDETGRECLERMRAAAARMQLLIEGLLRLSRVTTKAPKFERVDLAKVVAEVVSDLEVRIGQAGGRVDVGHLPTIHADALQMRQLFQNLIANAIKFRRPDEPPVVKIDGHFEGRRPSQADGSATGERCRIVVEDNGIGFEEEHRERVFDVFQRLHPRDVYEGTGIGLPICRKICERHGGSIAVRSSVPDQGTAFEVLLPAVHRKEQRHER